MFKSYFRLNGTYERPNYCWDVFLFESTGGIFVRSDQIKKGDQQAPARSLLHATGQIKEPTDMNKPFVAICNSYIDIVPGHVHLRELADIAKEAIREAGAIPF